MFKLSKIYSFFLCCFQLHVRVTKNRFEIIKKIRTGVIITIFETMRLEKSALVYSYFSPDDAIFTEIQSNYSKVFPRYKLNYFFHTLFFCARLAPPRNRDSSSRTPPLAIHPFMQRVYRVDSFNKRTLLSLIDSRLMALISTGNGVEYLHLCRIIGEKMTRELYSCFLVQNVFAVHK